MGSTSIQWTDKTWNPTRGCSRVSPGCVHCYAETLAGRYSAYGAKPDSPFAGFVTKVNGHASWTGKVELIELMLDLPLRWKKPCRIFVNSMSDLFHEALPLIAIKSIFDVMKQAHWHTYQILTKRAERMQEICQWLKDNYDDTYPLPNVWLGVSCEDQQRADERIPLLLETPAAVRFVSYEPALGPVSFRWAKWVSLGGPGTTTNHLDGLKGIDWVIVGGESGPGARPFQLKWALDVKEQCRNAGVKFFMKQVGSNSDLVDWMEVKQIDRKGGDWDEWPEDLRVREFPPCAERVTEAASPSSTLSPEGTTA